MDSTADNVVVSDNSVIINPSIHFFLFSLALRVCTISSAHNSQMFTSISFVAIVVIPFFGHIDLSESCPTLSYV